MESCDAEEAMKRDKYRFYVSAGSCHGFCRIQRHVRFRHVYIAGSFIATVR